MTVPWKQASAAPSHKTGRSIRQAIRTAVCVLSGKTKRDYKRGDIISLPYHTPNMVVNTDPNDRRLKLTCEGPVYSKRRMVVILWIHAEDMFCLPLFSHQGTGLRKKPEYRLKEYVCVKNVGDDDFENEGAYKAVEARCHHDLDRSTTIHITAGLKVDCNENTRHVGRIEKRSYNELVNLWEGLNEQARSDPW